MFRPVSICLTAVAIGLTCAAAHAQSASTPIKAGLWETTITTTSQMQLPPELQARIAAMTPQQQAMMKANMPGMGAAPPNTFTSHSCSTGQTAQDMMNQAQQKMQQNGGKCTLSNQTQTATSVSFDISCTTPQATATGHSTYTMVDSDHFTGTQHLTMQLPGRGGTSSMNMDSTMSSHYLGADCGSVQPNSSVVITK